MQVQFLYGLLPSITSTFLHSLWQGLIVAILASVVLVSTRRSSSSFRYVLLCCLFLLFLNGVLVTFLIELLSSNNVEAILINPSPEYETGLGTGWKEVLVQLNNFILANSNLVITLWSCIFAYKLLQIANDLRYVHRLRHYYVSDVTGDWKDTFDQLTEKVGISGPIRLAESALIKIPVIIGHLRPAILMPVGILNSLPAKDIEAVLLHELAHIRRHDYIVNFLQCITGAVFFFNPGFNWLSSLIRQERENCCDDLAIARTNDKAGYVSALISFKEYSLQSQGLSLGLFGKPGSLFQRVTRIVNNTHRKLSGKEIRFLALSLFATILMIPTVEKRGDAVGNITGFFHESAAMITTVQFNRSERALMVPHNEDETEVQTVHSVAKSYSRKINQPKERRHTTHVDHLEQHEIEIAEPYPLDEHHTSRDDIERYRAEAERHREEAEQHRKQAEEHRKRSAFERIEADRHRQEAEIHRREAELHRQQIKHNWEERQQKTKPLIRT